MLLDQRESTYSPHAFSIGPLLSTGRSENFGILGGAMLRGPSQGQEGEVIRSEHTCQKNNIY